MSDNTPPGSAPEPPSGGTTPPTGGSSPQNPAAPQQPAAPQTPSTPQQPAAQQQPTPPPPPPPPPAAGGPAAGAPTAAGTPGGSPTGVGAAINWSVKKFGENWLVLVGFALLIAITQGISFALSDADSNSGVVTFFEVVLSLALALAAVVLAISLVRASLKIANGEKAEWSDLWNPTHFWQYIGVAVVIALLYFLTAIVGIGGVGLGINGGFFAGAIGLVLALGAMVVGVLLWWLLQFSQWSVINEGRGIGAALSESMNLVKANKTESVLTLLVMLVLQFLGVLTCGIGTLVTLPIGMLFMAHMYRQFRGETAQISA